MSPHGLIQAQNATKHVIGRLCPDPAWGKLGSLQHAPKCSRRLQRDTPLLYSRPPRRIWRSLIAYRPTHLNFWATVCKTVRHMLSDRCLYVLSCPVCDVGVLFPNGRIKTKRGMQVGLGPGHIVLDGDPAPFPPKGHSPPIFGP